MMRDSSARQPVLRSNLVVFTDTRPRRVLSPTICTLLSGVLACNFPQGIFVVLLAPVV